MLPFVSSRRYVTICIERDAAQARVLALELERSYFRDELARLQKQRAELTEPSRLQVAHLIEALVIRVERIEKFQAKLPERLAKWKNWKKGDLQADQDRYVRKVRGKKHG